MMLITHCKLDVRTPPYTRTYTHLVRLAHSWRVGRKPTLFLCSEVCGCLCVTSTLLLPHSSADLSSPSRYMPLLISFPPQVPNKAFWTLVNDSGPCWDPKVAMTVAARAAMLYQTPTSSFLDSANAWIRWVGSDYIDWHSCVTIVGTFTKLIVTHV